MRRQNVASSVWRQYAVMCLLGGFVAILLEVLEDSSEILFWLKTYVAIPIRAALISGHNTIMTEEIIVS